MFGIENYTSFIIAIMLFQLLPGAGTITILNATARSGVGGGMSAVFGTLLGDFIYMLAAVLGLAAVLTAYPHILAMAQWFGVAYLCWLGFNLLRTSKKDQLSGVSPVASCWASFRQAFAVCLTNPKAIMFFMAFFPLFLHPESEYITLFSMMAHVTIISFLYQSCLVLTGNAIARRLYKWKYAKVIATRLAGIALVGFGVKLATNIK